ncbi:MAG: response regulator, partial [Candidatus Hodarchaeota archaeon]
MKLYKILIIDDEIKIRKQIVRLLQSESYETDEAESGEKALEKMKYHNYNVILLDLVMPGGMDGFEFLNKAKKSYP